MPDGRATSNRVNTTRIDDDCMCLKQWGAHCACLRPKAHRGVHRCGCGRKKDQRTAAAA